MIIVRLTGGLGNQMFQYAMARHLAEKQSTILKLDVSGFERYKLHRYALHCFQIWEYLATQGEIDEHRGSPPGRLYNLTHRALRKTGMDKTIALKSPTPFLLKERDFSFDPSALQKSGPLYVDGYWQSESYFIEIEEIIRREFEIKYKQDAESRRVSEMIQSTNAISLHVRRADYVQNSLTNQIHGTCDQAYYDRAIQHIANAVKNPHFFLFSDDPAWVRAELKVGFPSTIVDHNGPSRGYEDMRLMSQCKHNIIANSSFSWWGAWLNENAQKIVVAPDRWFADETRNSQAKNFVPKTWVKL